MSGERQQVEQRIQYCKTQFTKASIDVLHGKPNAELHARIALKQLNAARAELAKLDSAAADEPA